MRRYWVFAELQLVSSGDCQASLLAPRYDALVAVVDHAQDLLHSSHLAVCLGFPNCVHSMRVRRCKSLQVTMCSHPGDWMVTTCAAFAVAQGLAPRSQPSLLVGAGISIVISGHLQHAFQFRARFR